MKYCLIGETLKHSYSKLIHESQGYSYELKELKKDELESFLNDKAFQGFNVTIPYKKEIIKYLDKLSLEAKEIDAVNTVLYKNGKYYGYNTDIDGMYYMIKKANVSLKDKNVMILGSGGTSNTAVYLAKREKAKTITIVKRKGEVNYENCYDFLDTEIIINTTPVGMYPNVYGKIISLDKFKNLKGVFDCVYNPKNTELLLEAKRLKIPCGGGLSMLVEQALIAEDIWQNTVHSSETTQKIVNKIDKLTSNIALCGMPSAGKTSVGKLVAKKLNLEFFDSDEEITKKHGKTPKEIIEESGEECFRALESETVRELSAKSGAVISLGGGAVLREENVFNLKRNSTIVYIKRDISLLTSENRPLSKSVGIEKLYEKRKGIYESVSDITVENNSTVENCVERVIKEYENTCN